MQHANDTTGWMPIATRENMDGCGARLTVPLHTLESLRNAYKQKPAFLRQGTTMSGSHTTMCVYRLQNMCSNFSKMECSTRSDLC